MAGSVVQAIELMEFEDGLRTGVQIEAMIGPYSDRTKAMIDISSLYVATYLGKTLSEVLDACLQAILKFHHPGRLNYRACHESLVKG